MPDLHLRASPSTPRAGKRPLDTSSLSSTKRQKIVISRTENDSDTAMMTPPFASAATTTSSLPSDFFENSSNAEAVDESEWAAFQADVVAETHLPENSSATVITAAPTTSIPQVPETKTQEPADDRDQDEEDAQQKLLDEFEVMETLEQRMAKLKEQREKLKISGSRMDVVDSAVEKKSTEETVDDEDDEDVDDDEEFFRARG